MENYEEAVKQLGKNICDMKKFFSMDNIFGDRQNQYFILKDNCYNVLFRLKRTLETSKILNQKKYYILSELTLALKDKDGFSFLVVNDLFDILSSFDPLEKDSLEKDPLSSVVSQSNVKKGSELKQNLLKSDLIMTKKINNFELVENQNNISSELSISFWKEIFSLLMFDFDDKICASINNRIFCDILVLIDWNAYSNSQLHDFLFVLNKKIKDTSQKVFSLNSLKILIKKIQEVLHNRDKSVLKEKQDFELMEQRKLFAKTIYPLLDNISIFVEGITSCIEKVGDVSSYNNLDSLKKNIDCYQDFLLLHETFVRTYHFYISVVASSIVKKSYIEYSLFAGMLYTETHKLDSIYTGKALLLDRFFLALKQGYLLGDVYEFLLTIQKNIPEISYSEFSLQQNLDMYSKIGYSKLPL